MAKVKDLTGQKFGRLTVIECAGIKDRKVTWLCECECGKEIVVRSACLQRGNTRSCGCLQKELAEKLIKEARPVRNGTNLNIASTEARSSTGYKGVYYVPQRIASPYRAELMICGKRVLRKSFATLEEAVKARKEAEEKYHKPLIEQWEREKQAKESQKEIVTDVTDAMTRLEAISQLPRCRQRPSVAKAVDSFSDSVCTELQKEENLAHVGEHCGTLVQSCLKTSLDTKLALADVDVSVVAVVSADDPAIRRTPQLLRPQLLRRANLEIPV